MERYIGTKIILAEPMDKLSAVQCGLVRDGTATVAPDGSSEAGYNVMYEDGYTSWSPAETFERAYRRITEAEIDLIDNPDLAGLPHTGGTHVPPRG